MGLSISTTQASVRSITKKSLGSQAALTHESSFFAELLDFDHLVSLMSNPARH